MFGLQRINFSLLEFRNLNNVPTANYHLTTPGAQNQALLICCQPLEPDMYLFITQTWGWGSLGPIVGGQGACTRVVVVLRV